MEWVGLRPDIAAVDTVGDTGIQWLPDGADLIGLAGKVVAWEMMISFIKPFEALVLRPTVTQTSYTYRY